LLLSSDWISKEIYFEFSLGDKVPQVATRNGMGVAKNPVGS
jgi:hypothetical protein